LTQECRESERHSLSSQEDKELKSLETGQGEAPGRDLEGKDEVRLKLLFLLTSKYKIRIRSIGLHHPQIAPLILDNILLQSHISLTIPYIAFIIRDKCCHRALSLHLIERRRSLAKQGVMTSAYHHSWPVRRERKPRSQSHKEISEWCSYSTLKLNQSDLLCPSYEPIISVE